MKQAATLVLLVTIIMCNELSALEIDDEMNTRIHGDGASLTVNTDDVTPFTSCQKQCAQLSNGHGNWRACYVCIGGE